MFLLVDDLPGRTKRITVYAVDSVEKYCGLPAGVTDEYEIQLGRDHVELLEQLRKDQPYCGYLYVIVYTKNSYMYLSQN
jgi:hypothetical protein